MLGESFWPVRDVKAIGFARVLLGVAMLAWLTVPDAAAQAVGTFVPTGLVQREYNTATLLKDGRVLISGGQSCDVLNHCGTTASAELYNPTTGTFTPTGSMTIARAQHAATLLMDGRVLVAGGFDSTLADLSSAELYDPATGRFTATGNMGFPGVSSAILLSNGRVLVLGLAIGVGATGSAAIYDPTTGVFTNAGSVNLGSGNPVLLRGGLVLIPSSEISVYEISADSLKLVASFPVDFWFSQTATLLMNGKVLIAGGAGCDETCDTAVLYDPHSGTLEPTGLLAISRTGQTATSLPGGHVLIVGGYPGDGYATGNNYARDNEEYDPATGGFAYAGTDPMLRNYGTTSTLLLDGRVLIVGGNWTLSAGAELYIPPLRAASAASLDGPLAPESEASLFGSQLASTTASADPLAPSTSLGGISLRVRDHSGGANLAPLFLVSPTEIRFEVPPGTPLGGVTLELVNAPIQHDPVAAQVTNVAPGIFSFDDNMVAGPSLDRGTIVLDGDPFDFIFYATGIRNRSALDNVTATLGGTSVQVDYAGPDTSGVPGLDQVTIHVPSDFEGQGFLDLVLTVDGVPSNTTSVGILGGRATPAAAPRTPPRTR